WEKGAPRGANPGARGVGSLLCGARPRQGGRRRLRGGAAKGRVLAAFLGDLDQLAFQRCRDLRGHLSKPRHCYGRNALHQALEMSRGRVRGWFNRLNQNRPGVLSGAAQVNGRDIAAGASVLDWADIAPDPAYLDSAHIARGRTLAMVSA